MPNVDNGTRPPEQAPLLEVADLHVTFTRRSRARRGRRSTVRAVDGVSFGITAGEAVGLVGESGCGKTTTGRAIVGLQPPSSGSIRFQGRAIVARGGRATRTLSRHVHLIFQDPYSSLDPRLTVGASIAEPLLVHRIGNRLERRRRVAELLSAVGVTDTLADQYPFKLSGGQRQRVAIARALALNPDLLVLDEPTSALDVSVQAQVLMLLADLQQQHRLTYLFISHDLATVRWISDRVLVMYLGVIVESAPTPELFERPMHPYTTALLSAVPVPDPAIEQHRRRIVLEGDIGPDSAQTTGCRFRSRCWAWRLLGEPDICARSEPALSPCGDGRLVRCHFADETGRLADRAGRGM